MVSSPTPTRDFKVTGSALTAAIVPQVAIFAPETPLMEVVAGMSQAQFSACELASNGQGSGPAIVSASCALVMAADRVLGICTERDLVRLAARGLSPQGLTVAEVMTTPVITWTVDQLTDVFATLQFMQQRHIRHLPILDSAGQLLGMVTPQSLRQLLKLLDLLRLRQINEIMQSQVVQAAPDTSVLTLAQQMAAQHVSCVVIVAPTASGAMQPLGIVTERDIVQFQCLELNLATLLAHQVMSAPLCCLRSHDTLWAAHQLMQEKHIRRLVITDDRGHLAGLITQTSMLSIFSAGEMYDTLEVLQQRVHQLEAERMELLHDRNQQLEQQVAQRTAELQERAEREQFLVTFARQINRSLDLATMLTAAVHEVKQFLACDRVLVYQFEDEFQGAVVAEAVEPMWQSTLGSRYRDVCFPKWLETDYLAGHQRVVDDIYQANLSDCHIEFLESLQIKGYLIIPIVTGRHLWGLLVAHQCAAPHPWQRPNLDLLDRLGTQLAIAIQQSQLYQRAQDEIRDRQQAEQLLQQERNFAQAILNMAGGLVVVLDRQGQIVQFNQTCERVTGYRFEEVVNRPIWEIFLLPTERDNVQAAFQGLLAHQFPNQYENHWLTKGGEPRLIAWSNTALLDDDGEVAYIIATGLDVTADRQREAALERSETTNRALVSAMPDRLIRMNAQGEYLNYKATDHLDGLPSQQMEPGATVYQRLPPEAAAERLAAIRRALQTGQLQIYEQTVPRDGHLRHEEVRIVVLNPDEVLCIVRDISDRKRLEMVERQSNKALRGMVEGTASVTGENFFAALVEHLAEALEVRHTLVTTCTDQQGHTLAFYSNGQLQPNISYDLDQMPCEVTLQQQVHCCPSRLAHHFPDDRLAFLEAESYFGVALRKSQGETIGTLCIFDDKPLANLSQVESILKIFAARAAAELERQQTIDALQQLNQELESRVEQRTSELSASNVALLESNITLQKKREQLFRSEELLRLTIDSAPIGIVTTDLTGRFLSVNQAFCTMLGYAPAEMIAQTFQNLTHPEDRDTSREAMQRLIQGDIATFELEKRYLRKNGTVIDAIVRVSTVRDLSGEPLRFVAEIEDITLRKQAEAERTRLLNILEASLNEIYIFDASTLRFSYVNQGALQNLGYTLEQMQQITPADIKPTLTAAEFEALLQPLRRHEVDKLNFETVHQRADGSCYPVDVHLQLIERETEQIFLAVILDITERRQAEEQINRQLLAIETAIDGIAILREGAYQYLNQAHVELFGYATADELLGQSWQTLYSDAELARFEEEVFPVLGSQGHWRGEAIATRKDGSTFYEEVSLTLSQDGDLICVCRDINERKLAEVAMQQQLAAIEAASDGIAILDNQGRYVFVNTAHCQLFGLVPADLLGQSWHRLYAPDEIARFEQEILPALATHHDWRGEAIATRQDGSTFPQEVSLTQIEGVGLVCVCRDISDRTEMESERQRAEAEMRKALDTERELNDLKSRFVSMTSHEFRTPLGVIASSAGIIQDYGDRLDTAKQQKHLTRIQDSVIHMTQLLEDVLTLSRVEAGKLQLKLMSTSIPAFCQEIIEELNISDDHPRIKMQVDATFPDVLVVDQRLMRQILNNLLSNALKYSFPDSDVSLRLACQPNSFEIVIQDQGIGIPPEDLKHLFQSFHRAKNVGNIPGTGLGLSIVKKLVELQQGKIICQSEVNVGTTFILRFPLRLDDD